MDRFYPIGTPGEPWTDVHREEWLAAREVQRSYADEVRAKLDALPETLEVSRYGALSVDPERYPLLAVKSAEVRPELPWAVVTGGVHGYETSGVRGALAFLADAAADYQGRVNLLVAPCVSPWGYEHVNRWNPRAIDPNRSFRGGGLCEEAAALLALLESVRSIDLHIDLHETTDSDEEEFRPALAARDGEAFEPGVIPDGFYLVADAADPQPELQAAIIAAVEEVTHIAPPDADGNIIGSPVTQRGVIHYPAAELGLCAGATRARFRTTTEVYPDSPGASDAICNAAQVAAVRAGLDFMLASS